MRGWASVNECNDSASQTVSIDLKGELYQSLFRFYPDWLFVVDVETACLDCNDTLLQATGLKREQLIGGSFEQLIHPSYRTNVSEHFLLACEGQFQRFESMVRRKDSYWIYVDITMLPLLNERGIVAILCLCKDITADKQKRMESEEIRERYQLIAEHMRDFVSYLTPDGVIEHVSAGIQTVLGHAPIDVKGRPYRDYYHPEDYEHRPTFSEVFRQGRDSGRVTTRMRHKQGHFVWIETTYQAVRDEDGNVHRIVCVSRDVTSAREYEQKLLRTQAGLEQAHRLAKLGYFEWDLSEGNIDWSAEMYDIWDLPKREAGITIDEYLKTVHPDDVSLIRRHVKQSLVSDDIMSKGITYRIVRSDGTIRFIQAIANSVRNRKGRILKVFGVVQDVTDKKQTEELLLRSEKLTAVGQLAAGVAHEIRNPLTALKGFTQLLMQREEEAGPLGYLEIMQGELCRIEEILGELLVLAKPQATKLRRCNLQYVLHDVVNLLSTQATMHNISVYSHIHSVPFIQCESNQMKQVYLNIMKNALEAMDTGGELHVELFADKGQVVFRCKDTGTGISAERIAHLGEPFYTTKEKGTGLGLMMSNKIIQAHGGALQVFSEVGKGTIVEVRLPISDV